MSSGRITVNREYSQCTFRIPGGKVPRISSHCRVSDGDDRGKLQFCISAYFRQVLHHCFKDLLGTFCHVPALVYSGSDPYLCNSQFVHILPKFRMLENCLFGHIMLPNNNGTDLFAVFRYP